MSRNKYERLRFNTNAAISGAERIDGPVPAADKTGEGICHVRVSNYERSWSVTPVQGKGSP